MGTGGIKFRRDGLGQQRMASARHSDEMIPEQSLDSQFRRRIGRRHADFEIYQPFPVRTDLLVGLGSEAQTDIGGLSASSASSAVRRLRSTSCMAGSLAKIRRYMQE